MKKIGFDRLITVMLSTFIFAVCISNFKTFLAILLFTLIFIIYQQKKELHNLTSIIKGQSENYKSTLTHQIKTPVIAQIRAIELLLRGNFGSLSKEQEEMLKLTLNSCKHSYKIILTQLSSYENYNNNVIVEYPAEI